jgi:glutamate synthase domain-containing protein 3
MLEQRRPTEVAPILKIDTAGMIYRDLNSRLRAAVESGVQRIELQNVHGQRYIGTDITGPVEIEIHGTPGNDLGAFMDGPRVVIHGNAQDGCGNTMNGGEIVVHGRAGDIVGLSARGGKIFVRDDVGCRAGIHMKEYQEKRPVIVIGGTARDFLGEYMAGGILIVLGLNLAKDQAHAANYIGTGMHGGVIYLRGSVEEHQLGKEVGAADLDENDCATIDRYVGEFAAHFGYNVRDILGHRFRKLCPRFLRPTGRHS